MAVIEVDKSAVGIRNDVNALADSVDIPANLSTSGEQSTLLQTIINNANITNKRRIQINEGTFAVRDISIPSGTTLRGKGMDKTILQRAGTLSTAMLFFQNGASDIVISDMTIDGLSASDAKGLVEMLAHGSNIYFHRVRFLNGLALWPLRGSPSARFDHLHIIDCEFDNCPIGGFILLPSSVNVRGSTDIQFCGNTITRTGGNICAIHDVYSSTSDRGGFYINCGFDHNSITNCTNTGSDGPIPFEVWGMQGFTQNYNYIDSGTRGLTAQAGSRDFEIAHNVVKNQTAYFAEAGGSRRGHIHHNTSINCKTFYKFTEGNTAKIDDIRIHDNIIIGSGLTSYDSGSPASMIFVPQNTPVTNISIARNTFRNCEYVRCIIECNGTTNYPTVTFNGGGTGATATVTLKGSSVVPIDRGFRYTSAPTVTVVPIDGNGAGLAITATIDANGFLTGGTVTAAGSGYTQPPTLVLSGGGGLSGELEIRMAIDTVTPVGGTGYTASTFTVTGNGASTDASGTFTVSSGVPAVCTVVVAGEGFGRSSSFVVEDNVHNAGTFNSAVALVNSGVSSNFMSRRNQYRRTANYDSTHYSHADGGVIFRIVGALSPLGSPSIVSENDTAIMLGTIASGNFTACGAFEAATARYGCRYTGFRLEGSFGTPILFADSSGSTILEKFDIRSYTQTSTAINSSINTALLLGLDTGEFLLPAAAYATLGAAKRSGRRIRLHYEGATGTRTVKVRHNRTSGTQTPAVFHVDWVATNNNGTPQANRTTIAYGNVSGAANAPLVFSGNGTALTSSASATDVSGRIETTLTLPTSNNGFIVTVDAELNAAGTTQSWTDFSVQVG